MANKKINLTKGVWLILLCVGIIFLIPNYSQALDLNNVEIKYSGSAHLIIANLGDHNYATEYYFKADELGPDWIDAFCVENAWWDPTGEYELVSLTGLENAAKVLREYYYGAGVAERWSKEATQIAIWELAFDPVPDLLNGNLIYKGGAEDENLLNTIIENYAKYDSQGPLSLALSPRGSASVLSSQNYALPTSSVPDAGIMWLLGPTFIMLGLFGRKKPQEQL